VCCATQATKLARALPEYSILLLESGSLSQSNVLERLQEKRNEQHVSTCLATTRPSTTSDVNKFDIPLLWSGVAGSRSRRKVYGMDDTTTPYLWPGPGRTLLGRTLGGSGLLNAMIYVRSLRTDWERWNITGWTFDDVLPHYLALEKYTAEGGTSPSSADASSIYDSSWRGTDGPIHTMAAGYGSDAVAKLFVKAAQEAGFPLATAGFNHPDPGQRVGAGFYEFNIRDGKRDSVAQALLGRQPWPSNLQVHTGVTVTRILTEALSSDFVRTNGVAFQTSGGEMGEYLLTDASAEVILAAGAILTPQLLIQSGIGPKGNVLSIPGVGSNCQDHPVVALVQEISPELAGEGPSIYSIGDELDDYQLASAELDELPLNTSTEVLRQHVMERLGTLGTAGFAAGAFLRSPWASDQGPDIQLTVFPRVVEPHVTREQKRQKVRFMHSSAMLVTVALLEADARYVVRSSTPKTSEQNWVDFEAPGIDLPPGKSSYLSENDVDRLAWGVTESRRILNTATMAEQLRGEIIPGSAIDGDRLRDWIQKSVLPNAHWVGTTRMGSSADPMTVVDEQLMVRGTQNLRVVDAGVIAGAPSGNVHCTVTVVASRGADLIARARSDAKE
jgi:choline dehydrogenase-like flavoprotein